MTLDESLAIYRYECVRGEIEGISWYRHLARVGAYDAVFQVVQIAPGGWRVATARTTITGEMTATPPAPPRAGYIWSAFQAGRDRVAVAREKPVQLRRKRKRAGSGGRRSRGR